jgi:uncharacterized protein YfaP (DUF2135 family)
MKHLKFLLLGVLTLVLLFSFLGCTTDSDEGDPQPFDMTITGLSSGATTTARSQTINADVPNPNSTSTTAYNGEVRVYVNSDYSIAVPAYDGTKWRIDRSISINAGSNAIRIDIYSGGNLFARSNTVTITGNFAQVPYRFELTWNTDENDLDLHLVKNDGWGDYNLHCYYGNDSIPGVASLDYDFTDGYGPENISIELGAPAGTYKVYVKYYSADMVTTTVTATVKIYKNGALLETKTRAFTPAQESYSDMEYEDGKDWLVTTITL